jgi:hypothetical protein
MKVVLFICVSVACGCALGVIALSLWLQLFILG